MAPKLEAWKVMSRMVLPCMYNHVHVHKQRCSGSASCFSIQYFCLFEFVFLCRATQLVVSFLKI